MLDNNNRFDSNRQRQIDKAMCKPGYTWMEMPWKDSGGKCVPSDYAIEKKLRGIGGQKAVDDYQQKIGQAQNSASGADKTVASELQMRQTAPPAAQQAGLDVQPPKAAQLQQLGKNLKKKAAAASQRTALDLM